MVTLYFEINNIEDILQLYNQIQIVRYTGPGATLFTPSGNPADMVDWEEVSGVSPNVAPVNLFSGLKTYYVYDDVGNSLSWYSSRYIDSSNSSINSGWSTPVLGDSTALYRNPLYPSEVTLTSAENRVVDRIRLLIGDPYDIVRDHGEEALSNLYSGGNVYKLNEKGWPISVNMGGVQYTDLNNPTVNGYRYLRFNQDISDTTTVSGVTYGIDVWYYTFRYSDKEILDAYDNTPVPIGLTTTSASTEAYILSCAIDLLRGELFLDLIEDGTKFTDDKSLYDPVTSLETRRKLLEGLEKKLDKLIKISFMANVQGVLID
jgi:hypothetical protein